MSIYYTFDFFLTFYLAPNKFAFIFSELFWSFALTTRPGLIDVITSFPILIIMIYMKLTDSVASWIVKLPAFRIYIHPFLSDCFFDSSSCDSIISHVAKTWDSPHPQCLCWSSHVPSFKVYHSFPLFLLFDVLFLLKCSFFSNFRVWWMGKGRCPSRHDHQLVIVFCSVVISFFIITTTIGVGYGNVYPKTTAGKVLVIALFVVIVIFVPRNVSYV